VRGRIPKAIKYWVFFSILCLGTLVGIAHADSDGTIILQVRSTADGKVSDGAWVEIKVGPNLVHAGFTPLLYNATQGITYTVNVSDYGSYGFQSWNDGSTNYSRSVTPASDTVLVAHYIDKASSNAVSEQPQMPKNTVEPALLPDWLRGVASSWLSGQLSDKEFIVQLQRLVDQKILIPAPEKDTPRQEGFSNTQCKKGERHIEMVGKYTNGDKPYEIVSLRMTVLDSNGEILASGSGTISNIGAHESKYFNVIARHSTEFASCEIQVESVLSRLASRN
jgi:hypothetical protein